MIDTYLNVKKRKSEDAEKYKQRDNRPNVLQCFRMTGNFLNNFKSTMKEKSADCINWNSD